MQLILEDSSDIERAQSLASWLNRPRVEHVQVLLPWLNAGEQTRAARAIQYYLNDCGCLWGAAAFLLVLIPSVCAEPWGSAGLRTAAVHLAVSLGAALVAKLAGLGWSSWRLKVLLSRLMA